MKKTLLISILCSLLCACSSMSPKPVTAAEFQKEYAQVGMAQTMHHHTYLGQREGRAYLEIQTNSPVSGWTKRIISVDIAKLDPKFAATLPKIEMKD